MAFKVPLSLNVPDGGSNPGIGARLRRGAGSGPGWEFSGPKVRALNPNSEVGLGATGYQLEAPSFA